MAKAQLAEWEKIEGVFETEDLKNGTDQNKDSTVELFNKMVSDISKHLEYLLNINREYRFQKIDLMNFGEYFNLEFDRDGAGEIYPDISVQFEEEPETEIGKKGKKGKGIIKKK